jgi:predicted metal-dependent peptidase
MDPREILSSGRLIARRKAPYFRAILLTLVPREMPGLGTIAVTDTGFLLWDPEAVAKWTPEQMGGGWLHEVLHRLNRHGARVGTRDRKLFNMAGDLAINTTVKAMGAELPPGGLFPAFFKFPDGLSSEEYYELLLKKQQEQLQKGGKGKQQDEEQQDKPCCGGGWCGSAAGRKVEGEPDGNDPDARSEAAQERAVRETAEEIKDFAAKNPGKLPAGLQRFADEILQPAKVPWQKRLASMTRHAVAWSLGAMDHRYDAPSRRQAGIGFGNGRPILPRLRRPIPRVGVGVDTSGSMGKEELTGALIEVRGILQSVGADVDFIACDSKVHAARKVASMNDVIASLKGGGGTDFRPVFEALEKLSPRPKVFVFATDGYGPAPEAPPFGVRVIWLLIGKGAPKPAEWGDAIWLDD